MNRADDSNGEIHISSERIDSVAFPLNENEMREREKEELKIIDRSIIDAPIPVITVKRGIDKL